MERLRFAAGPGFDPNGDTRAVGRDGNSPGASSTVTTGCVANGVPPLAPPGSVEKTNLVAGLETPLNAMPTMGLLRGMAPAEPSKAASP